jgi:hypothetical protein
MVLSISDEKGDIMAIVSSKEEAVKIMEGHPKWQLREIHRIWP